MDKDKSLTRSKKTALSLGDIFTTAGLSAIDPSLAIGYKSLKVLKDNYVKWRADRNGNRLLEFHQKVFTGEIDGQDKESFLKNQVSEDDYYSFLNFVVQDDEDAKVDIYANIFKAIALNEISIKHKAYITKSARELNLNEFELMKEIFLVGNEDYFTGNQVSNMMKMLLVSWPKGDAIMTHEIQQLIRMGFLFEKQAGVGFAMYPEKTELLDVMVKAVNDPDDLSQLAAINLASKKFEY